MLTMRNYVNISLKLCNCSFILYKIFNIDGLRYVNQMVINNTTIHEDSDAYLIAEIGLNHNKSLDLAFRMIDAAKANGANAVKFQSYITEKLVIEDSPAFSLFKNLELSQDDHKQIAAYCNKNDMTFFSTPLCLECVDWLEALDVPCYKIASMDSNYFELLEYISRTGKPIILSTGMTGMETIEKAVNVIEKAGNSKILIMHTISKYPPEYKDMNLRMIEQIRKHFGFLTGFSDHTMDNLMSVIARTLGSVMFERHFTLDRTLEGPDQAISLEPADFANLRKSLDNVDLALQRHTGPRSDAAIEEGARRSLYAAVDIAKGSVITDNMIDVLRPASGLLPEQKNLVVGKKSNCDISKGQLIDLSCV